MSILTQQKSSIEIQHMYIFNTQNQCLKISIKKKNFKQYNVQKLSHIFVTNGTQQ